MVTRFVQRGYGGPRGVPSRTSLFVSLPQANARSQPPSSAVRNASGPSLPVRLQRVYPCVLQAARTHDTHRKAERCREGHETMRSLVADGTVCPTCGVAPAALATHWLHAVQQRSPADIPVALCFYMHERLGTRTVDAISQSHCPLEQLGEAPNELCKKSARPLHGVLRVVYNELHSNLFLTNYFLAA